MSILLNEYDKRKAWLQNFFRNPNQSIRVEMRLKNLGIYNLFHIALTVMPFFLFLMILIEFKLNQRRSSMEIFLNEQSFLIFVMQP